VDWRKGTTAEELISVQGNCRQSSEQPRHQPDLKNRGGVAPAHADATIFEWLKYAASRFERDGWRRGINGRIGRNIRMSLLPPVFGRCEHPCVMMLSENIRQICYI